MSKKSKKQEITKTAGNQENPTHGSLVEKEEEKNTQLELEWLLTTTS